MAATQAPADVQNCQHRRRARIRCSDPVRSGSHHLLSRFRRGSLGLGRSARRVLRKGRASSSRAAIGQRGDGERPEPTRAETGGHGRPATISSVDVAAQMWPPACEPVAAVARPPMRRSPRRRPGRVAPDRLVPRRGIRPLPLGLISQRPWQVTPRPAGDPQRWQRSPVRHLQATRRCGRRWTR